jgi:hypothetical protein
VNAAWVLLIVVNATEWLLPAPTDKWGWGLRVRIAGLHQPFLAQERFCPGAVEVSLINQTKEVREYLPLFAAHEAGDLQVQIVQPDGQPLRSYGEPPIRHKVDLRTNLPAGRAVSTVLGFDQLG